MRLIAIKYVNRLTALIIIYIYSLQSCSRSGGGVGFCHDYGLVFFISVHDHLLLASGETKILSLSLGAMIPLENHCFGDRPFLPFEVGRARANALISLAWLK